MDSRSITFSQTELLLLEKVVKWNVDRTIVGATAITDGDLEELALRIGSAMCRGKEDELVALVLSEKALWFYRETISIFDKIAGSPSEGYTIKVKLYDALLDINTQALVKEVPQMALPPAPEAYYEVNAKDALKAVEAIPKPKRRRKANGPRPHKAHSRS